MEEALGKAVGMSQTLVKGGVSSSDTSPCLFVPPIALWPEFRRGKEAVSGPPFRLGPRGSWSVCQHLSGHASRTPPAPGTEWGLWPQREASPPQSTHLSGLGSLFPPLRAPGPPSSLLSPTLCMAKGWGFPEAGRYCPAGPALPLHRLPAGLSWPGIQMFPPP